MNLQEINPLIPNPDGAPGDAETKPQEHQHQLQSEDLSTEEKLAIEIFRDLVRWRDEDRFKGLISW